MEENNDIGEIITQALNSEVINKYRYNDGGIAETYAETMILYCIITRDSNLPENISLSAPSSEYLCNKAAQNLGIDKSHIGEKKNEIFDYIYNNLIQNGFCFHITNSKLVESIIQSNGMKKPADTSMALDISNIYNIMKKYGNAKDGIATSLFVFSSIDIKETNGFFYSCYPGNIDRYLYSPEWFKLFCRGIETHSFTDEKYDAFERKDYERITEGIQLFISKYNISEQDANVLREFLNKYWKMFEDSKPILVLIPRKILGIDNTEFKDFFEDMYSDDLEDFDREDDTNENELYYRIDKLLEYYRKFYMLYKANEEKSEHNIELTNLSFANLTQLMPEKSREKLQASSSSEISSWDNILRRSLEMGVTTEDCLAAQKAENLNLTVEGEISIDD